MIHSGFDITLNVISKQNVVIVYLFNLKHYFSMMVQCVVYTSASRLYSFTLVMMSQYVVHFPTWQTIRTGGAPSNGLV